MAKELKIWEQDSSALPGITEAECQAFETAHQIELPLFLKEIYQQKNGGLLQNAEGNLRLLPIGIQQESTLGMCTLDTYSQVDGGVGLDSFFLDWIESEFKDLSRVILIGTTDGDVVYALNYNAAKPGKEPTVVELDFDGMDQTKVAVSFEKWIKKLVKITPPPKIDWNEIEKYEVLFRSQLRVHYSLGNITNEVENVLCKSGDRGLILFEKTEQDGQLISLSRCSLTNGVDGLWLDINPFRPEPNKTFQLQLQPSDFNDISWVMGDRSPNGRWMNIKSKCNPQSCHVESQDSDSLQLLTNLLKERGFVDEPDLQSPDVQQMLKLQELARKAQEAPEEQVVIEPNPELPVISTENPGSRTAAENLEELTRIIRSWAGQIRKIQTLDDAQAFIKSFQIFIDRLIAISMQTRSLSFVDSNVLHPLRSEIDKLKYRDFPAYRLIELHRKDVYLDSERPPGITADKDEFLVRYDAAARDMESYMKQLLETKTFDPEIYQSVFGSFVKLETEWSETKTGMDENSSAWVTMKRFSGSGYRDLAEQMNLLKTNHRNLFKKHREHLQKLDNMVWR